jgi:hypothetical protein
LPTSALIFATARNVGEVDFPADAADHFPAAGVELLHHFGGRGGRLRSDAIARGYGFYALGHDALLCLELAETAASELKEPEAPNQIESAAIIRRTSRQSQNSHATH